jgi:mannitol/fructose-specific phosphotransferase system IIA component (Ntr-type)
VYWFYGRVRVTREFALLHLIERITAKELTSRVLETELKEIIRERDDITKDRFDRIIEHAKILDIRERLDLKPFFSKVADAMAESLNVKATDLLSKLVQREEDSSTAITEHLAIPHIVLEGDHRFDILLVRCKPGIEFSHRAPKVQAVFVLAGTKDERNFHLRALSAVAQIVQDPDFMTKWTEARSEEALRDIVLLGKRMRH